MVPFVADKKFYWEIKYHLVRPDGPNYLNYPTDPFMAIGIDDGTGLKTPGPELIVDEGDNVEIIVTNHLPSPTTIHWHGLEMKGTMYADGANGVTQWPIPPGSSYIYRFTCDKPGTYFYHSHFESQVMDQLAGALNVIEKTSVNPFANRYLRSDDVSLLIGGLPRRPALGGVLDIEFYYRLNHQSKPDILTAKAFHLNGQSSLNPVIIPMKPGVTKRIRLTNINFQDEVCFTVEGHTFEVIAFDTEYHVPFVMNGHNGEDCLVLLNGQRADILVTGLNPGPSENFKLNVFNIHYLTDLPNSIVYAVLNYEGVDPSRPPLEYPPPNLFPTTEPHITPHPLTYHAPPNIPFGGQRIVDIKAHSFWSDVVVGRTITTSKLIWGMSIDGSAYAPFHPPPVPTIFDDTFTTVNRINVPVGQVVDFVVYNYDVDLHPWHLHGYHTYILGTGIGYFNTTPGSSDIASLNMVNPPKRDVLYLGPGLPCTPEDDGIGECVTDPAICGSRPACSKFSPKRGAKIPSWIVHRVVFDHEGPFLIHCHVTAHVQAGFAAIIVVGNGKYNVPSYIPRSTFTYIPRK